jgi:hypothetical protein
MPVGGQMAQSSRFGLILPCLVLIALLAALSVWTLVVDRRREGGKQMSTFPKDVELGNARQPESLMDRMHQRLVDQWSKS